MEKALIIVDVQNDFCPNGNLAVANGAKIIPAINKLMERDYNLIVATQDWHPPKHISFAETHGKEPFTILNGEMLWTTHCVQGTFGAELHKDLNQNKIKYILRKGMNINIDSYSAFLENDKKTSTGLASLFKYLRLSEAEIHIVGIATDVCVFNTAIDANNFFGKDTWNIPIKVFKNACAPVTEQGEKDAIEKMQNAGILIDKEEF